MDINSLSDIGRIMAQSALQAGESVSEKTKQKKAENNIKTPTSKKTPNAVLDDEVKGIHASVDIEDENIKIDNVKFKKKETGVKSEKYSGEFRDPKLGRKINIEM